MVILMRNLRNDQWLMKMCLTGGLSPVWKMLVQLYRQQFLWGCLRCATNHMTLKLWVWSKNREKKTGHRWGRPTHKWWEVRGLVCAIFMARCFGLGKQHGEVLAHLISPRVWYRKEDGRKKDIPHISGVTNPNPCAPCMEYLVTFALKFT